MSNLILHRPRLRGPVGSPLLHGGLPCVQIGRQPKFFETDYFKYGAAPQYLLRYWVELNKPHWNCTCPDFVYRRSGTGTMCKHCMGAAKLVQTPIPFVQRHIREISEEIYNKMIRMSIGQYLPIFGQPIYVRVQISGQPGYIGFIRHRWRCYTCGGPDGSRFLKGKQCKHIACHLSLLESDDYDQYCVTMYRSTFFEAVRIQRNAGQTHWHRF